MSVLRELLAPVDAARLAWGLPALIGTAPRGDGHRVIVLPGFCAGPQSTSILRWTLNQAGYRAVDWGQGTNVGPSDQLTRALDELLAQESDPVSLVGWSLGGLYARALANRESARIRRVITLGSPHRADFSQSKLKGLFDSLSPRGVQEITAEDQELVRRDPSVPLTSLYTKNDGLVEWRDCLCDAENVEVQGTHMGLTHNLDVFREILARLPQR